MPVKSIGTSSNSRRPSLFGRLLIYAQSLRIGQPQKTGPRMVTLSTLRQQTVRSGYPLNSSLSWLAE